MPDSLLGAFVFLRPKLFLTFLAFCLASLTLFAAINYWNGIRLGEAALLTGQEHALAAFTHKIQELLYEDENELTTLSQSKPLHDYVKTRSEVTTSIADHSTQKLAPEATSSTLPDELRVGIASALHSRSHFASIGLFDRGKHPVFLAERATSIANGPVVFRTKDFLSEQNQVDDRVWSQNRTSPGLSEAAPVLISSVSTASSGGQIDCSVPIFSDNTETNTPQAVLVGRLILDRIFFEAARGNTRDPLSPAADGTDVPNAIIVFDRSGRILYHSNEALRHQLIGESVPYFQPAANRIYSSEHGREDLAGPGGEKLTVQYTRVPALGVWSAVMSNHEPFLADWRRSGRTGFFLAALLGLLSAVLLTLLWQRQTRGLERVTEGVEAIAKGKLDHRIDLQSSDDLRPLADNLGLMTKQLRDQLAREAETKQFQSFVRLSAILTHDLKNAIEALSLTVANMEWHFDKKEFRADAMKSVTGATNNLRALVARLTQPVTTLSGEHKRPQPVDLVPMLRQVISMTADPARGKHEMRIELPESLYALVDIERMNKVVENLIINALEAMNNEKGTLTVAAGTTAEGKPFFSVSDTGEGMSRRFIEEKLFRPFATTKKRGVGLGLYTCREVVVANGGSIEVDSQEGVGTTFRVVLPSTASDRSS